MAILNRDLSILKQAFTSQIEVAANTSVPVYSAPQNKTAYVKKIAITNNTASSGTFDISLHENKYMQGGNLFVAFNSNTSSTTAASSTDGITWTLRTLPAFAPTSAVYGNGKFLGVGNYPGGATTIISSTNGITWTTSNLDQSTSSVYQIAYGNGNFLALGNSKASISTDGISWLTSSLNFTLDAAPVIYGNNVFVTTTYTNAYTSTNGITWTQSSQTFSGGVSNQLTYGNGLFISMGLTKSFVYISTDGLIWSKKNLPSSVSADFLSYGNGQYFANNTYGTFASASTDGINWTLKTLPSNGNWEKMIYGNNKYVLMGTGNSNGMAYSTDLTTWTLSTMPAITNWRLPLYPQRSDFSNDNYLYKSVTLAANTTQSISYELITPPTHEIRVRSSVPVQVTINGEV